MAKADPPNSAWIGALFAALALPCPTNLTGDVAHRGVVRAVDRGPDHGAFGGRGGNLCRQCHRLMRRKGEVIGADLAIVLGPSLPGIAAPGFEQTVEVGIPRHGPRVDAEGFGHLRWHIR